MAIPIILILAVLWVAFFTWPLVQRRRSRDGRRSLGLLSRVGRQSAPPSVTPIASRSIPASPFGVTTALPAAGLPMSPIAQKRRRDAFVVLGCAVMASALLAVFTGNLIMILASVAVAALFIAYVVALVQLRRRSQERSAKVLYMPQPVQSRQLVLHRSVSSSR